MKKLFLLVVICLFLLSACVSSNWTTSDFDKCDPQLFSTLKPCRVVDEKASVVCYLYKSGISCLPLSETSLGEGGG